MKLFAPFAAVRNQGSPVSFTGPINLTGGTPQGNYLQSARGYSTNEIVYSAIELLATSAAEPHIIGRRNRRASPMVRNEIVNLKAKGLARAQINALLIKNGFVEALPAHPLVKLLNNPNPYMSRGQLWSTLVMDRYLAGNAYVLKARAQDGPLAGAVGELWRLRPDRVRIIPDSEQHCRYEYRVGSSVQTFDYADVMHFKTRNPFNEFYGMPPLMVLTERLSIDRYMSGYLRTFFERGGGPGSIFTSKGKLSQDAKDEIRERMKYQFGGQAGWHEMMVLDNTETTYTPLGLARGLRDALPKELDAVNEARTAMVFGIPGSIIGLLIGYESSSYANKRQDWQVLWDITMTPLLSDMDDVMNLSIVPDFGGIDEVLFDLSDIKALQEDVDKINDRHRKNVGAGIEYWEEAREGMGLDPNAEGTLLIPSNMVPVRIRGGEIEMPAPAQLPAPQMDDVANVVDEVHCPECGRWVGRNVNVGATVFCPKCKEVPVA